MSTRRRSGPRRRLDVLGDVGRAKLREAIHRALAAAEGDYEVVAGLFGLPLSAVYALVEPESVDRIPSAAAVAPVASIEDEVLRRVEPRASKRRR
jgi:hypothetical protein